MWMDQPYQPWRVWPDPDGLFLSSLGKVESRRRGQATQEQGLTVAVVVMGEAKAKPNARGWGRGRGDRKGEKGGDLPPGGARRRGGAHPVGEGEAGQRLPSLHPGTGGWVGVALRRAALVGRHTERCRDVSPRRVAGEGEGRQTENAPHCTRPERLEGRGAGVRGCVRGRQQMLPSAPSLGKDPKTPASARVGRGQLRWGRLRQPYKRPPRSPVEGGTQCPSHTKPPRRCSLLLRWWGQQQTASSKRTRLRQALLVCGLC